MELGNYDRNINIADQIQLASYILNSSTSGIPIFTINMDLHVCRIAHLGPNKKVKDVILYACDLRNNEWYRKFGYGLEGHAISDLHAADAQYHRNCMSLFSGSHNVQSVSKTLNTLQDEAFVCPSGRLIQVIWMTQMFLYFCTFLLYLEKLTYYRVAMVGCSH